MRVGARLYAVEATLVGRLFRQNGELLLELSGSKERVRLAPLTKVVEWDVARKRPVQPLDEEKNAYAELAKRPITSAGERLTLIGALTQPKDSKRLVLEVRSFQ